MRLNPFLSRRAAWLLAFAVLAVPARPRAQTTDYKLGTGDKLKVTVFGEDDASGEYEVDASGSISPKLLGRTRVQGMTLAGVEQLLAAEYRNRNLFRNPRISIELVNLRPFFILGEVEKRGAFPYMHSLNVAQAVAIAGGYSYRASRSRITVQRFGSTTEEPANENTPVFPGDIIRVPERFF